MPVTLVLASDEWFLGGEPNAAWEARGRGRGLAHHNAMTRRETRDGIDQLERATQCRGCLLDVTALHGPGVQDADAPGAQEWEAELKGHRGRRQCAGYGNPVVLPSCCRRVLLGPQIEHPDPSGQAGLVHDLLQVLAALGTTVEQRAVEIRALKEEWDARKARPGPDIHQGSGLGLDQWQRAERVINVRSQCVGVRRRDESLGCSRNQLKKAGEGILFHVKLRNGVGRRFT